MGADSIGEFAFWLAVGLVGVAVFFGPVGKGLGRWLENWGPGATRREPERLGELEARLGQLEETQARVAELEERLDFAERLLAQQKESARLGRGEG